MPGPWRVVHASAVPAVLVAAWAATAGSSWQLVHTEVSGAIRVVAGAVQNGSSQNALLSLPASSEQVIVILVLGA